jgi:hypothetical protein
MNKKAAYPSSFPALLFLGARSLVRRRVRILTEDLTPYRLMCLRCLAPAFVACHGTTGTHAERGAARARFRIVTRPRLCLSTEEILLLVLAPMATAILAFALWL